MCSSILLLLGLTTSVLGQCNFRDGQCTYNINLAKTGNCDQIASEDAPQAMTLPEDTKMVRMQQDFDIVKSDHENRIKELESSIQKVMRNIIPGDNSVYSQGPAVKLETHAKPGFVQVSGRSRHESFREDPSAGNILLLQLQTQFNKMRNSLSSRTAELLDVKNKLNETIDLLTETQRQNFEASTKLVSLETNSAVLNKENSILKNKLKSKTERLNITEERLNASETKLISIENQLYDVVRSEALIKEELETLKIKMQQTLKDYGDLQVNHTELTRKYGKTKTNLEIREAELMECYTAKTQTFCDFEDPDMCGFRQDQFNDTFDWERVRGKTPSANTGPEADHTCNDRNGHFMYIEASGKSRGENAKMVSPKYRALNPQCVQFYYHMYGRHTGTLTFHTKVLTSEELRAIWRVYGNQGNLWIKASVTVSEEIARSGYQLIIEATAELGYEGDISIDDLRITDGQCANDSASLEITPSPLTSEQKKEVFQSQIERYRKLLRKRLRESRMRSRN